MKIENKKVRKHMKKRKITPKHIVSLLLLIFFLTAFTISIINITKWLLDSNTTNTQIEEIQNTTEIEEITDNENTEIIEQEPKEENNPYWDYIKMNLINVDFQELKSTNNQIVGWIQVNGTNINYPFVQANDNKYYLTHSFDKSHNTSGWVFLDYRNNIQTLDKNTILYAHGRIDKTMFGTLKNILNNDWLTNTDNYIIKLSTEYENSLWQIFSAYHIPTTSDYLQINFENNEDFKNFANMLTERSQYNFNTTVNENDHILTLSTCYNSSEKMVIHAKLIKKETR